MNFQIVRTTIGGCSFVMFNVKVDGVETNYIFDNDYRCHFRFKETDMTSAEQAYNYAMYLYDGDAEACIDIMMLQDPEDIRKYAKKRGLKDPGSWMVASSGTMIDVLTAKFIQNNTLKNFLLSTKGSTIVGISYCDSDGCTVEDDGTIIGCNKIGNILMEIRKELELEQLMY